MKIKELGLQYGLKLVKLQLIQNYKKIGTKFNAVLLRHAEDCVPIFYLKNFGTKTDRCYKTLSDFKKK